MAPYSRLEIEDGWTRRHVGAKGILLRRNPAHIHRVLEAIHRRYERDSDMRLDTNLKELMQ